MNKIQIERIEVLQKVINNIKDENKTNFADTEELTELLKKKIILDNQCRPIWQSTIDNEKDSVKKYELELKKEEVEKKLIIRSDIEKQIKEIEIEITIYSTGSVYELHEFYEEFWKSQKQTEIKKVEHFIDKLEKENDTSLIIFRIEESSEVLPLRGNDFIDFLIDYTEDEILSFKTFRLEYLKLHLEYLKEDD